MTQTLKLPDDVYRKLANGAAERGVSIESLLTFVSDALVIPEKASSRDRKRNRLIEALFEKYRKGELGDRDRARLDKLIESDYDSAIARADQLIAAKANGTQPKPTRK